MLAPGDGVAVYDTAGLLLLLFVAPLVALLAPREGVAAGLLLLLLLVEPMITLLLALCDGVGEAVSEPEGELLALGKGAAETVLLPVSELLAAAGEDGKEAPAEGVCVPVPVSEGVPEELPLSDSARVPVGLQDGVGEGEPVPLPVGEAGRVGLLLAEAPAGTVAAGVGEGVSVSVAEGVAVGERLAVLEPVPEREGEGEAVRGGVPEGVADGEGEPEGVAEGVKVGEGVSEAVQEGVGEPLGLALPSQEPSMATLSTLSVLPVKFRGVSAQQKPEGLRSASGGKSVVKR